ncbi:hypothetical protein HPP92_007980 [Vanilla planifolia]|uniref:CMP/dCMP-type deaminase domain-containing protein n=1 Tax=Vanilla planifolia TaxID=51239 RepID=A0A835RSG8_VANPL|nr:hypothetical protein HPP92_007980 [Vanilla planifolia]
MSLPSGLVPLRPFPSYLLHKTTFCLGYTCKPVRAASDNVLLLRAAEVSDLSAGFSAPHPNFGCVIAHGGEVVGEGFLYAQGTKCAELQAVEVAGELARGATAYLNMEPGDCHAEPTPVASLVQAGISRVVIGIRHPLGHLRGRAINSLRSEGVRVEVVGEELSSKKLEKALNSCLVVNAPLLYRAAFHVPFSVLKYAMTLDGKIAASSGDASWVSSKLSRGRVFELRGRSDAIVVGGNTVRRDEMLWNIATVVVVCVNTLGMWWELAAPAISSGVIHKVYAFIAPKIIGGRNAPSPVGDLGMVQMSQALNLIDVSREEVGPDTLISGFLQPIPDLSPAIPSIEEISAFDPTVFPFESKIISFYKTWDPFGSLSNFSPHYVQFPDECGEFYLWPTVEHFYQAQKFAGVNNSLAKELIKQIKCARSPEEAARIGRKNAEEHPELVRRDWESIKVDVMYSALRCKFSLHPHLNALLRSTAGSVLVEASPHDLFWGGGRDGEGLNYLGRLLMKLRSEILEEVSADSIP